MMIWKPWHKKKEANAADSAEANAALATSTNTVDETRRLAEDLERLRRQNHLAPRFRAALYQDGHKTWT